MGEQIQGQKFPLLPSSEAEPLSTPIALLVLIFSHAVPVMGSTVIWYPLSMEPIMSNDSGKMAVSSSMLESVWV